MRGRKTLSKKPGITKSTPNEGKIERAELKRKRGTCLVFDFSWVRGRCTIEDDEKLHVLSMLVHTNTSWHDL